MSELAKAARKAARAFEDMLKAWEAGERARRRRVARGVSVLKQGEQP